MRITRRILNNFRKIREFTNLVGNLAKKKKIRSFLKEKISLDEEQHIEEFICTETLQ